MKKEKIFKWEKSCISFIEKHIEFIVMIFLILLSLVIRYFMLSYQSGDFVSFLKPWFDELKSGGGFKAIADYSGDYNMPYITILALLTYLKVKPLISIKIVSIVFDYILAFLCGKIVYDIKEKDKHRKYYSIITFGIMLFLPTILLNSSLWAQCDIIYTTFLVLSFYLLNKNKITMSFISLGIAFAFKLQFIFVLPVYMILYFRNKNFSILNFLFIPIVNFVLCIPAMISGKSMLDCLSVYFKQTSTYNSLNLNFPNIYAIITGLEKYISKLGIIIVLLFFILLFFYIVKNNVKFNTEKILLLTIWSILICTFFLPYMHERYMFAADIFSVLYFLIYKRNFLVTLVINIISLISYTMFLFQNYNTPSYLLAIILFIVILYMTKDLKEKLIK